MATRDSEQQIHSNWDLEIEQASRDDVPLPTVSNIQDPYQTNDELLTEDEDDTDFYGVLLSPLTTTSQTISTTDIPLASPATQLAESCAPTITHTESSIYYSKHATTIYLFLQQKFLLSKLKAKRLSCLLVFREVKRLALQHNPSSEQTEMFYLYYLHRSSKHWFHHPTIVLSVDQPKLDIRKELPNFYNNSSSKDWQERTIYIPDLNYKSPTTGLTRTNLYVFAIDANAIAVICSLWLCFMIGVYCKNVQLGACQGLL